MTRPGGSIEPFYIYVPYTFWFLWPIMVKNLPETAAYTAGVSIGNDEVGSSILPSSTIKSMT